jgi:phosphoglycerate dehydrogenase-like enzyme
LPDLKLVVMGGPWANWLDIFEAVSPNVKAVAARGDALLKEVVDADIVFGRLPEEAFDKAGKLKWVQSIGVGFETMLYPKMIESDVVITNASGAFDSAMAEHALALTLSLTRGITTFERMRKDRTWSREVPVRQIDGATACVLGLGTIGRNVSSRLGALGMTVIAVDAQVKEPPAGVSEIVGPDRMLEAVGKADVLIVALPLTDRTRGIVDSKCFKRMKASAIVINVARGPIINESDLIAALQAGEIAGAGMDVFEKEPLPSESPLWDMDNVIYTSHVAGLSAEGDENLKRIFSENLRRYIAGEPLMNIVDKRLGYVVQNT